MTETTTRTARSIAFITLLALTCAGQTQQQGGDAKRPEVSPLTSRGGVVVEVAKGEAAPDKTADPPCAEKSGVRVAVVIKGRANLRDRANIAGAAVARVKNGSTLVIEAEDGPGSPWFRVTDVHTGKQGWVHGDTIRIVYGK